MNRDEFWQLINSISEEGDKLNALQQALEQLEPAALISFQTHFDNVFDDAYTWSLWGAAYIIDGGCGDDGFIDFRYALIARGREVYERAVKDPDTLADLGHDVIEPEEALGYVAMKVFETKTGEQMVLPERDAKTDPLGQEWDFDDWDANEQYLPRVAAAYG